MMKTSTKLSVIGAASLLGVALAATGAYAANGSLTTANSPGQVLQVSGVGPASGHASAVATAHANTNAKGLFGSLPAAVKAPVKVPSRAAAMPVAVRHSGVAAVPRLAPQPLSGYHGIMHSPTYPSGSGHPTMSWSGSNHPMTSGPGSAPPTTSWSGGSSMMR